MLSLLLLASTVFASTHDRSSHHRFAERVARRHAEGSGRPGSTNQPAPAPPGVTPGISNLNQYYSTNWAGAGISKTTKTWKSITGTFVVPTPKRPSGGNAQTQYGASIWVGIDGNTCQDAIWQTGIDIYVKGSTISYDCWYEFYPEYATDFPASAIHFSPGDSVTLTITVGANPQSGTAVISNNTTGKKVTKVVNNSGHNLCQKDVEIIVEDFTQCINGNCGLFPLANWGIVHFTKTRATDITNKVIALTGAYTIDLVANNTILTDITVNPNGVVIKYSPHSP